MFKNIETFYYNTGLIIEFDSNVIDIQKVKAFLDECKGSDFKSFVFCDNEFDEETKSQLFLLAFEYNFKKFNTKITKENDIYNIIFQSTEEKKKFFSEYDNLINRMISKLNIDPNNLIFYPIDNIKVELTPVRGDLKTTESRPIYRKDQEYTPTKIKDINLESVSENMFISLNAKVVDKEETPIKDFLITTLTVTDDDENYIKVTEFSRLQARRLLKDVIVNNEYIISGFLKHDTYREEIVLSMTGVAPKLLKEFKKKVIKNDYPLHVFNLKTNYSDHYLGIPLIRNYKNKLEELGLKRAYFSDYLNCHAFPEIQMAFENTDIKPRYGISLDLIDEQDYLIYRNKNNSQEYVGLDIETSGLTIFDEIIEVGIYSDTIKYETLLKVDVPLSDEIIEITGITDEMLSSDGREQKEVLKEVYNIVKDKIIIGHNASFDVGFLERKFKKYLDVDVELSYIDTLNFSRAVLNGETKRFGLERIAQILKVDLDVHHRGLSDAKTAYEIFSKLFERINFKEKNELNVGLNVELKYTRIKQYETITNDGRYFELREQPRKSGKSGLVRFKLNSQDDIDYINVLVNDGFKIEKIYEDLNEQKDLSFLNDLRDKGFYEQVLVPEKVFIFAKNQKGLKSLYELVSLSLTENLSRNNRLFVSDLLKVPKNDRKNLVVISDSDSIIERLLLERKLPRYFNIFDYVSIKTPRYYSHIEPNISRVKPLLKYYLKVAERKGIKAIYDENIDYIEKDDYLTKKILMDAPLIGGAINVYRNKQLPETSFFEPEVYVEEATKAFGKEVANKLLFENKEHLDKEFEDIVILDKKLHTPDDASLQSIGINSVSVFFKEIAEKSLYERFLRKGEINPYIKARYDKEMKSIIKNGFEITYVLAYLLVKKSNEDGYIVGSRGSVGSSFVANLLNITEVDPLPPHYYCPNCKTIHFEDERIGDANSKCYKNNFFEVKNGFDLPDETCVVCKEELAKNGNDIPFETFLGFDGNKVPDIDLNFSGLYQAKAHDYIKELFGEVFTFRAGTIMTIRDKTAFNMVAKYFEKLEITKSKATIEFLSKRLLNIKRTTGQHPGGIVIVPNTSSIHNFTPVQYPANNKDNAFYTTHFDFEKIHDNLLKLDILGHDDPTIYKNLSDYMKERPDVFKGLIIDDVSVSDPNVLNLFLEDSNSKVNTLGVPEFGTTFVMELLKDARPKTVDEIIKVSGLSHGTDVWLNNAKELVLGNLSYGKVPFADIIGCRDDIMINLINDYDVDKKLAFEIMEFVRKGKPSEDPKKFEEYVKSLKKQGVPEWIIFSLSRIKYMFPKAHATAYSLMALRIAWFKVYHPIYFYATYLSTVVSNIKIEQALLPAFDLKNYIEKVLNDKYSEISKVKEAKELEVVLEAKLKNIKFLPPTFNEGLSDKFKILNDGQLMLPLSSLDRVGIKMAERIIEERTTNGLFADMEDFEKRMKPGKIISENIQKYDLKV